MLSTRCCCRGSISRQATSHEPICHDWNFDLPLSLSLSFSQPAQPVIASSGSSAAAAAGRGIKGGQTPLLWLEVLQTAQDLIGLRVRTAVHPRIWNRDGDPVQRHGRQDMSERKHPHAPFQNDII